MVTKKAIPAVFAALGLSAATLFCGCWGANDTAEQGDTLELRTYKVPEGLENDARDMLRAALGPHDSPVGQVRSGPGGMLVVVAPRSLQTGVERVIDELREAEPGATRPVPVKLTYWIVLGRPARESAGAFPSTRDVRLDGIEPVLAEITRTQGPMAFQLLERLQLGSAGEREARMNGSLASIEQRATVIEGSVVGNLRISLPRTAGMWLDTEVKLEPGQSVVLGQSGFRTPESRDALETEGTLFYVINSDLEP